MLPPEKRMYVVVRRDLSEVYRMVQGSHALAQFAIDYPYEHSAEWKNEYLIYLSVFNLIELRKVIKDLLDSGEKISIFREPDLDGQETGIALYTYTNNPILRKLPLA